MEASFERLIVKTANFVSAFVENLTVDELTVSDKTSGQGLVEAGSAEIVIGNSLIKENSKIFVTFRDSYEPATQYWVEEVKEGESFKVRLNEPVGQDTRFDYWIVN